MPAPDHPWYGRPGRLKRPSRTISDELFAVQLNQLSKTEQAVVHSIDDETVRAARDPSYTQMSEGAGRRWPVRYD